MAAEKLSDIAGWPVLHQFFRVDRVRWRGLAETDRRNALNEFITWLRAVEAEEGMQLVPLAGIAKFDFGIMAVHPNLRRIQQLGQQLAASVFGTCLTAVYAFLSVSEVSEYMSTVEDHRRQLLEEGKLDPSSPEFAASLQNFEKQMRAYAEARVHPRLPRDMDVICFYPMSKARGETHNWYTLPFEERKRLMRGHAETGRRFAGRVLQLVTSCTGLDDWEWGVTLFARDLESIRDVVYEMRFDPASAIYGEFGEFYVALRFSPDDLAQTLQLFP